MCLKLIVVELIKEINRHFFRRLKAAIMGILSKLLKDNEEDEKRMNEWLKKRAQKESVKKQKEEERERIDTENYLRKKPPIKPIETVYKGYRFRSRTEARWAVFFDTLKIKWEYEVEGYQLPSGWYLPDFLLHIESYRVWAEIKGTMPKIGEREHRLCHELCHVTGIGCLILVGQPGVDRGITMLKKWSYTDPALQFTAMLGFRNDVVCQEVEEAINAARSARF